MSRHHHDPTLESREPDHSDYMVRAIAGDGLIRVAAVRSTGTVAEAQQRHGSLPTATAALGRVLTGTLLLGTTLKDDRSVTVRVAGTGPLGTIIADGDGSGHVRGYVQNPQVHLPPNPKGKLDVAGAVGVPGYLHVTRDPVRGQPYTGTAELVSGEIAEDFTAYLFQSEQVPSMISLGVLVAPDGHVLAAGGVMLQLMPGADPQWSDRLEKNAGRLADISHQVEAGLDPESMAALVLEGFEHRVLDRTPVAFRCRCSRERSQGILLSLGRDELLDLLQEQGGAELRCHFCNAEYRFHGQELKALADEATPD